MLPSPCRIWYQITSPFSPVGKNTRILAVADLVFECSSRGGDSHFSGEEKTAHSGCTVDCPVHNRARNRNKNNNLFFIRTPELCIRPMKNSSVERPSCELGTFKGQWRVFWLVNSEAQNRCNARILTHKLTHRERFLQSLSATWQPPRECKSLIRRLCLDCHGRGREFESRRPRQLFNPLQTSVVGPLNTR